MSKIDIYKIVDKYHLNNMEEDILTYIIDNIDNVKSIGVRGIAKQHYTSTTTVMSLAKKLGYSGFIDMYYNLYFTLRSKKSYFSEYKSNDYFGVDIEELLSLISEEKVAEFVNMLHKYKKDIIYTYAVAFSEPIIRYITRKLIVMGFRCIFSDMSESYDVNSINGKILITVSKSGETDSVIRICKLAKKSKVKIISITGETESTLEKLSDINFKLYDMHTMDDRNKLPTSFYANVIMLFEFLMGKYLEKTN